MTLHIRAVIFDMDGVLTDSEPLINAAAIAMFKEKGLTVQPDDFLPFVGAGRSDTSVAWQRNIISLWMQLLQNKGRMKYTWTLFQHNLKLSLGSMI